MSCDSLSKLNNLFPMNTEKEEAQRQEARQGQGVTGKFDGGLSEAAAACGAESVCWARAGVGAAL